MRLRKKIAGLIVSSVLAIGAVPALVAQERSPDADNTKQNQRDRVKSEPTADQAKNNLSDREIMQQIRKAVVGDKSLSTYAHNVKIIAQNGKVSLKGPVRSEEEKQKIEQKATDVAGSGNVTNEITVKPARDK
jgi:hyperosmotically inducible periplasmic protein